MILISQRADVPGAVPTSGCWAGPVVSRPRAPVADSPVTFSQWARGQRLFRMTVETDTLGTWAWSWHPSRLIRDIHMCNSSGFEWKAPSSEISQPNGDNETQTLSRMGLFSSVTSKHKNTVCHFGNCQISFVFHIHFILLNPLWTWIGSTLSCVISVKREVNVILRVRNFPIFSNVEFKS